MGKRVQAILDLQSRMVGKLLPLILAAGLLLQALLPPVIAATTPDEIRVGFLRNFPPQYSIDPETGNPAGFAVDIINEVAKRAGLRIVPVIFDEIPLLIAALREGRIDVIPNAGVIEEREEMAFTRPVEVFHIHLFVRETTSDIRGIDDLRGRNVAAVENNKGLFLLKDFGKAVPVVFGSLDEALLSLLSGNSDALIYPEPMVWRIAAQSGLAERIKTAGEPLLEVKRAIAVRKGRGDLLRRLDAAVAELIPTEEYRTIYARWHGAAVPYWSARRVLTVAGIVLLLLIILFAAWHCRSLRRLNRELGQALEEQKQDRERIRQRDELLRAIVSGTPDHLIVQDRDLRYSFVLNPPPGATAERMIGKTDDEMLSGEDADRLNAIKRGVLESGRPVRFDLPVTEPGGERNDFEGTYVPKFDAAGRVDGLIGYFRNVTDRKRTEEALKRSEQQFRMVVENTDDLIMVTQDGRAKFVNRWVEWTGYTREEYLSIPILDTIHPDDREAVWSRYLEKIRGSTTPTRHSYRGLTKGGEIRWIEVSSVLIDWEGRPATLNLITDITERRRVEEALRNSEATVRALVDALPDLLMRFDRDGRHLFVTENVMDIFDMPAENFIGRTHRELGFPEAQCRAWEEAIHQVFDSGAPFETEFTLPAKRGKIVFNWRLLPEFSATGRPETLLSISRDITAHRKAEQAYQTLFREMLDGFALHEILCDAGGRPVDYRFLAVNPAFERLTGLKAEQVVGNTVMRLLPGTEPFWIETYGRVALTGQPAHFESGSGELGKHFEVRAFCPAPHQFATVFVDITERKRAEAEHQRIRDQLRALAGRLDAAREEERSRIAREIHDELGGALTGLKIDLSLLNGTAMKVQNPTSQKSLLAGVASMTDAVDATIRTVRRIAMELRPGLLDDLGLVAALEWQLRDFERRTGIRGVFQPPAEEVSFDAAVSTALFRICQEALTNVVRHSGATEVSVRLRSEAGSVTLEVRDNGKGIEAEKIMGSGSLGLLGMRERALMFGGSITVTGSPGVGTTVVVEIAPPETRTVAPNRKEGSE